MMAREHETICPICGQANSLTSQLASPLEHAEQLGIEAVMAPGDATMCISCGQMSIMGLDYKLRLPTPEEKAQLDADVRVQHMLQAWREVRRVQ